MKTAKEIADLARSTNVLNEDATQALGQAIAGRAGERIAGGESSEMEDALTSRLFELREHARRLVNHAEGTASSLGSTVERLRNASRSSPLGMSDLTFRSNNAPSHLGGVYDEAARSFNKFVDLFEAVADLVRATPEEREAALAARKAEADAREAAATTQPHKTRKGRPV